MSGRPPPCNGQGNVVPVQGTDVPLEGSEMPGSGNVVPNGHGSADRAFTNL
ncbi:hypothetical protein [Sphingobium yanoikuyae]|jgi:hypothetical protein|uniref:hypothetical protein n=1 Tax=Sphingobium yanoikuyae TaxID=13690 RepID=UPI00138E28F9|nr:hypothetical protein [Sphingobium yanoikuyae]|tara:strand:+ start:1147 stop:1299 length:153 start_codon:yes stop_codon:yes gene_type:complete